MAIETEAASANHPGAFALDVDRPGKFTPPGLTFDDVLLVPGASDVLPSDADTGTIVARDVALAIPIMSAAMDTVTEARMAVAMARLGGIGVLHRNLDVASQVAEVEKVKRSQAGMITDPVTLLPEASVADAQEVMARYRVSGVPVVDAADRLLGIVTNRDLRFVVDPTAALADVMTPMPLATAGPGTTLDQARTILQERRVEKLPIVDADGRLVGLITVKDIRKAVDHPHATLDAAGRLRVAAAVGAGPSAVERAEALAAAGVDLIVVDTAHGHAAMVLETVRALRARLDVALVAGNVATAAATCALIAAGVDAVKVGIGPGSICTTRVVAGVGVPQVTAIHACAEAARGTGVRVIGDGGVRSSGDVAKAIAAGADVVMLGSMLAGVDESPGRVVVADGQPFKEYRGMGSLGAMGARSHSRDRYFQGDVTEASKLVPEGVEGRVRYRGPLAPVLYQVVGGLRQAMGYCGAPTIPAMQERTQLMPITGAGVRESHPHTVEGIREAPNYTPESWDR